MKTMLLLLVSTFVLMTNFVLAQNCPSSPTYKNVSSTISLAGNGYSYVANDGKVYNVVLQNGFSSTSTICVTNGSTLNLSISNFSGAVPGGVIYVDASSKLNFTTSDISNFPFTINNYGTLSQNVDVIYQNGAVINNYGTYTTTSSIVVNTGTVTLNNSGTMNLSGSVTVNSQLFALNNQATGTMTFKNSVVFNTTNDITNKGTINFNGAVTFNSADYANSGYTYFNKGSVIINNGSLVNYGLIAVKEDLVNNSGDVTNYCTITATKSITQNNNTFTNYGNVLLPTNTASSFIIQGKFVNGPDGFVQGYDFTNNNSVTGGGDFYFAHTTINSGTFSGSATSNINFYDASNSNTLKFFDTQNSLPVFTTKNAITPVNTTNLVACGDPAPPAITTQPANVILCDNSFTTATFSVAATSYYSSMTYQWRKNGANIAGATSSSYTAKNLTLADTANAYTVAITNNTGTTISNSASVDYIIVAQPAPASLYLATGSAANFTIKTSGATAWQWQKNGAKVAGATTTAYSIAAVKTTDAGNYTALVTYNGGTCLSDTSILTVENLPAITTQPQAQVLCTGTTSVSFSVAATSTSAMTYQWYKNNAIISGATAATYTATGLTMADTANTYKATIKNGVGTTTSNSVGFKYAIISQPANQSVATGSAATFSVTASSVATSFQWQKNGTNIAGATARTYTINAVAAADAGNYTVIVSYAGGSCTSSAATLTVLSVPTITTQPATANLCDTTIKTASFNVNATSTSGTPTYQWRKNGVNITGATSSTLQLSGLSFADTTNAYSVAITNQAGTTISNNAFVHYVIIAQPAPASLYIATGSTATFTIQTSGATAWQWKKNGNNVASATAPAYNINNIKTTDAGNYTNLVTYNGGTCTSNAAVLKVEDQPVISAQPQAQVLCSGTTSVSFSVTASSLSAMTYQWYNGNKAISGATTSTYTATGLTLADTANAYSVKITNGVGSTTSNSAGFKYVIVSQPVSQTALTGTSVTFSVTASSVATGYKWQKDGKDLAGSNTRNYTIPSVDFADAGNYVVIVNYTGGTCTSNAATLTVKSLPTVTVQPKDADFCETTGIASFGVTANSQSGAMTYQWRKNGVNITGATGSALQLSGLTSADTANRYTVAITNPVGTTISAAAQLNPIVITQPVSLFIATGNVANLSFSTITGTSNIQWYKNNVAITKDADKNIYKIPVVNQSDSGTYKATFTYSGGVCATTQAIVKTAIVLYSKASGSMNTAATWGVNVDGSGSTPVDFTRDEHTFIVANRNTITTTADLTIAGTLDLNNGTVSLAANTDLTVGRIIRSGNKGTIAATATSSIKLTGITTAAYAGASDLYFAPNSNTIGGLYTAGHTVNLRSALNLTAGTIPGILQVQSGAFNTFDQLTLKSDSLGTAFVYTSLGVINGKATIEKFFPARRAYRFICSPVAANGAPTINAAWQEGATSSTDNPKPGYGTHITYGAVADGFDQNPQKSFSMYVLRDGGWYGVPATKTTKVTDYPAFMTFIRGDRSYDITTTTSTTTPKSTILRTTGNLNQGTQSATTVNATGYTLVANPYASPIDFDVVAKNSNNIKQTARIWDPKLAGTKGVGAYVTVDFNGTGYITTPPSDVKNIIPAGQGFWVQSADGKKTGTLKFDETSKYLPDVYAKSYNTFKRATNREATQEAMLEVDLKVFNEDGTTGIADGVLYHFADDYANEVDDNDITKMKNLYENLSISNNSTLLTVERRQAPLPTDTLQLSFTGSKSTSYQLQFVPMSFSNITVGNLYLYDRYLNTKTLLSNTDTTRITISINTADAASKDANRFSIVGQQQVVLPVTFSAAKAYAKEKTVQVEWKVATEVEVKHYEIERSANGTTFSKVGEVNANGVMNYSFNDAAPFNGNSYYRVKSVDKSGKTTYTKILPVTINNSSNVASSLNVYPNPLKGKTFQVQISNKAAGAYTLYVISNNGQQLFTQAVNYGGGTAAYTVQLKGALASGIYFIKAVAADGTADVLKVIVE